MDLGLARSVKGSILYAALKGATESGLNVPHSKDILPEEKRIASKEGFKEAKEKILTGKW